MGRKKHDYDALKTQFVTGPWNTVTMFCKANGLRHATIKAHSTGWVGEQRTHRERVAAEMANSDVEGKVLNAELNKTYVSAVITGILEQWQDMRREYIEIKTHLQASEKARREAITLRRKAGERIPDDEARADISMTLQYRTKALEHQRAMELRLTELIKTLELLSGHPTERTATVEEEKRAQDILARIRRTQMG